jgi:pterin-4a-carbinolamine dehydratase
VVTKNGWRVENGRLVQELAMRDFDEAFGMVARIAAAAEDHLRRPDMCISEFNRVRIIVSNPHRAGHHRCRAAPGHQGGCGRGSRRVSR